MLLSDRDRDPATLGPPPDGNPEILRSLPRLQSPSALADRSVRPRIKTTSKLGHLGGSPARGFDDSEVVGLVGKTQVGESQSGP